MSNPFIAILKNESRSILITSSLSTFVFLTIYYFLNRDSYTILIAVFFIGAFYSLGLLNTVKEKQKLLMVVPASSELFIQAIFLLAIRTILTAALLITPFYFLAATFDKVKSPLTETIILYIVVIGTSFVFSGLFIWLYFFVSKRTWLSLIQLASLLIVTLISFSILMVLNRIGLHFVIQLIIFTTIFSSSVFYLYKKTIQDYKKFNLL